MDIKFWKWWTVANIGVLALILSQYSYNIIELLLLADVTYLSFLIAAIAFSFIIGILFNYKKIVESGQNDLYWFASDAVLSLGMVGTIIGFLMVLGQAFIGIDPSSIESMTGAITILATGMSTALTTTLVGLITSIWMKLQLVILEQS
jgi:hypothetical protein